MYTKDEPDTRRTIKVHSERIPGNVISTIHATHCNICALENDNTVWENAMMEVDKTSRNENCLNLKCYFNVCLFKYYCCSYFVMFNVIYERCVSFFLGYNNLHPSEFFSFVNGFCFYFFFYVIDCCAKKVARHTRNACCT